MRRSNHFCRILHVLLAGLLLASLAAGCLLNADSDQDLKPGTRDYTWSVDTLDNGPSFGYISDLWGASPDNVWAVARAGLNFLWHYDGSSWRPDTSGVVIDAYSIYGLGKSKIWVGGSGGHLYHFNGSKWSTQEVDFEKVTGTAITSIHGNKQSNLYAVGYGFTKDLDLVKGIILRYNGESWKKVLVTDFYITFHRVSVEGNNVFIFGTRTLNNSKVDTSEAIIYKYDSANDQLQTLRSGKLYVTQMNMNRIGDETAFVVDKAVMRYNHGRFDTLMQIGKEDGIIGAFGRHEKDIFINSTNGLLHYNGQNKQYLLEMGRDMPDNVWRTMVFEDELIFNVAGNGTNYMYHGIQKDTE